MATQEVRSFHENSKSLSRLESGESGDEAAKPRLQIDESITLTTPRSDHHTYQTGEPGHVCLAESDTQTQGTMGYVVVEEESQNTVAFNTQDQPIVTSPTEIPFSASRKRDFRGNLINNHIVSPIPVTPKPNMGVFNFSNNQPQIPLLNDIFLTTQADNDPPPDTSPQQDHIFERPSPEFRPAPSSSPQRAHSSPIKIADDTPEANHEPRTTTYVSMRQSQELRERRLSEEAMSSSPDLLDDGEDDELGEDSLEFRQAREREKTRMREQATKQLAQLGHSNLSVSRHITSVQKTVYGSRGAPVDLVTPSTARQQRIKRPYIPQDIRIDGEDLADIAVSDEEAYDEYDELSQAVLTSDRPEEVEDVLGPTPNRFSNSARSKLSCVASSPLKRSRIPIEADMNMRLIPATQQSNTNDFLHLRNAEPRNLVENSQPRSTLQQTDSTVACLIKGMQPSSIDSKGFISESQSIGLTLSSGNGGFGTLHTIPPESIVSSVPRALVLSSQSSRRSKEDGDDRGREESPASSPPPTVPRLRKDQLPEDEPIVVESEDEPKDIEMAEDELEKDVEVVNEEPILDQESEAVTKKLPNGNHEADVVIENRDEEEALDQLDHLAHSQNRSHLRDMAEATPQPAFAERHTRLSNRSRHQIPDSSAVQSTPGRTETTRAVPDHVSQEPLPEKDEDRQMQTEDEHDDNVDAEPAEEQTDSMNLYSTARSNQKTSNKQPDTAPSPVKTKPTSTRIPKMSEIAMQASPEQSSAEFNVSNINMNIMDDDDVEFEAMMNRSGPLRKRLRVTTYGHKVLPQPASEQTTSSPLTPLPAESTPPTRKSVRLAAQHTPEGIESEEPVRRSTGKLKRTNLVPSPARAVAKMSFTFEVSESPQPQAARSGRSKIPSQSTEAPAIGVAEEVSEAQAGDDDVEMEDAVPASDAPLPLSYVIPSPYSTPNPADHRVPDRVIARFVGTNMAYYPATCLGPTALGGSTYRVRFDDGTVTEVDAHLVRRLEIRPGENVRVDLSNMRKNTWIVKGFKDNIGESATQMRDNPITDIHGFQTIKLEARQRKSLPANGQIEQPETIDVAITNIYLTLQMINQLKGREYHHPHAKVSSNRMVTPFNIITAIPSTPPSRTRRKTISDVPPPSRTLSLVSEAQSGLFANMAFVISYKDDKHSRDQVTKLILNNGGLILCHGLDELFEPSSPLVHSPSESPFTSINTTTHQLTLSPSAGKLGFTVLIADAFSRKEKYLQALALNIPCLSGRWVMDAIARSRLLPLDRYLLPAGESAFLYGAVRSRTFGAAQLKANDPLTAKLPDMIERRTKLAKGKNVIVVTGATKSAEDKRKAHLFLMSAIGAARIERVKDLNAAKDLLAHEKVEWDWVYVDDASTTKAERFLGLGSASGAAAEMPGRKRKRRLTEESEAALRLGGGLRVVNDEFVVQSLILGSLAEDV